MALAEERVCNRIPFDWSLSCVEHYLSSGKNHSYTFSSYFPQIVHAHPVIKFGETHDATTLL